MLHWNLQRQLYSSQSITDLCSLFTVKDAREVLSGTAPHCTFPILAPALWLRSCVAKSWTYSRWNCGPKTDPCLIDCFMGISTEVIPSSVTFRHRLQTPFRFSPPRSATSINPLSLVLNSTSTWTKLSASRESTLWRFWPWSSRKKLCDRVLYDPCVTTNIEKVSLVQ